MEGKSEVVATECDAELNDLSLWTRWSTNLDDLGKLEIFDVPTDELILSSGMRVHDLAVTP